MEGLKRKPFQGVTNIIRFNWHFYVIAFIAIAILLGFRNFLPEVFILPVNLLVVLSITSISLSLAASYYIYDLSNLYSLDWLNRLAMAGEARIVNINAGFDETSTLLQQKYPSANLTVFDFYDPVKHTEVSIERARKAYPAFPGTKKITSDSVPLENSSTDCIFLVFSAHEIRNTPERIAFFKELHRVLNSNGKIVVVEHQRDIYNFIVYNFGFFHFFSGTTWRKTFASAELIISEEFKITPFITTFILQKNGTTS